MRLRFAFLAFWLALAPLAAYAVEDPGESEQMSEEEARRVQERLKKEREERIKAEEQAMRDADKLEKEIERRNRWLRYEMDFVAGLGLAGYDDLAREWLTEVKTGTNEVGEKLTPEQLAYLNKASAELKLQRIYRVSEAAQKVQLGQETIALMQDILTGMKGKGPLEESATQDMIEMYFKVANHFAGQVADARDAAACADKAKEDAAGTAELTTAAAEYYAKGMEMAEPLREAFTDKFEDSKYKWNEAKTGPFKDLLLKRAERYFMRKVELMHMIEEAYTYWPLLYPRGSAERDKIVAKGLEFIDFNLFDYEDYLPGDKRVYMYWIQILGLKDDPILEKDEEGNVIRYDDGAEKTERDYYIWNSDRMAFLLDKHVVMGTRRPVSMGQQVRIRSIYYYAKSMARMALGALKKAQAAKDPAEQDAWVEHAKELMEKAEEALADTMKAEASLGPNETVLRYNATLNVYVDYCKHVARYYKEKGDTAKAKEYLARAQNAAAGLQSEVEGGWLVTARNTGVEIKQFAECLGLDMKPSPETVIAEAKKLLIDGSREKDEAKQRELMAQARDKYWEAIAERRGSKELAKRAAVLPEAYSYVSLVHLRLDEFYPGYIAAFEAVQEFTPKRYDPDRFPKVEGHVARAIKNLRFAAAKQMKRSESDFDRKLFVDALLIEMNQSDDPDLLVQLINNLKRLKMYEEAIAYIRDVPENHLYYRIVLLMAADMYQTLMKQKTAELKALRDPDKPVAEGEPPLPEGEALATLKKQRAALQEAASAYRSEAETFARLYLQKVKEQQQVIKNLNYEPSEKQKEVWSDELENVPSALMISIWLAFIEEDYEEAIAQADRFLEKMVWPDDFPEEKKAQYLSQAHWMRFISKTRVEDVKTGDIAKVAANLEEAGQIQSELAAADVEGEYTTKSYQVMGAAWNDLAKRVGQLRDKAESAGDTAKAAELEKEYAAYRLNAAQWFKNAEPVIYRRIKYGLAIGSMFMAQEMHEDAAGVFGKMIEYWDEALFTPVYLFASGKGMAEWREAAPPEAVADEAAKLANLDALKAAADEAALVKALNDAVRGMKAGEKKAAALKVLDHAAEARPDDKKLQTVIAQAKEFLELETRTLQEEQKVNRVVLEALYPDLLARSDSRPRIPGEAAYETTVKERFRGAYLSEVGREEKAPRLKLMHDPTLITSDQANKILAELKQARSEAKDPEERAELDQQRMLYDPGLRTLVYGVEEQGKRRGRNYTRARGQIQGIFEFNQTLPTPRQPEVPTRDFLKEIDEALEFGAIILMAKQRLAEALVARNQFDRALRYLEEVIEINPNNPELLLALAKTYRQIGSRTAEGADRPYDEEAAKNFMMARLTAYDILTRSKQGSPMWWMANQAYIENEAAEVEARTKSGEKGKATFKLIIQLWDPKTETKVEKRQKTSELDKQATRLTTDIPRMEAYRPDNQPPPEAFMESMAKIRATFKELGFDMKELAPPPPPTPQEKEEDEAKGKDDNDGKAAPKEEAKDGAEDGKAAETPEAAEAETKPEDKPAEEKPEAAPDAADDEKEPAPAAAE